MGGKDAMAALGRVKDLDGQTRRRSQVILEVLAGRQTATEASRQLGVSRERYYELERSAVAGLCEALKPKKTGRPPREREPQEVRELRRERERFKQENETLAAKVEILKNRGRGGKKPGPPGGGAGGEPAGDPRARDDRPSGGSQSPQRL